MQGAIITVLYIMLAIHLDNLLCNQHHNLRSQQCLRYGEIMQPAPTVEAKPMQLMLSNAVIFQYGHCCAACFEKPGHHAAK
ncbi:uncharacterized, partial [Tachysurus ichikawai]